MLGGLVERPNDGAFIRAASSKDLTTRLSLRVGALLCWEFELPLRYRDIQAESSATAGQRDDSA